MRGVYFTEVVMDVFKNIAMDIMDYHFERDGTMFHSNEVGFFRYKIDGKHFLCYEFYVKPKYRKTEHSHIIGETMKSMARTAGCEVLVGWIDLKGKDPIIMHKYLTKHGGVIHDASDPEYHEYRIKL